MRSANIFLIVAVLACLASASATAQTPVQSATPPLTQQAFKAEQLDSLLSPIALYDDNLLAQVLMASTYPLEIVQANRWVKDNKSLKGDALKAEVTKQTWDDSVKMLAAVPPVLEMMSSKLDWTQKLGDAVLAQQSDVMDSIQRLRSKAQARGKLESTKQQNVSVKQESSRQIITIEPAVSDAVYVPYYDPAVVYGAWDYPTYPPYYWPAPGYIAGAAIATGIAWGTAWAVGRAIVNGGFNWGGNSIVVNRNNDINIGNKIGDRTNFGNWQHSPEHRQGVRYNNDAVRQKFSNRANTGSANQRLDFRGRDGQQVLRPENRPSMGDKRPSGDRPNAGNRPGGDKPKVANRGQGNRAGQGNRPQRDTGFSNIQSRGRVNAQSNRGHGSLASRGGGGGRSFAQARGGGGGAPRAAARGGGGGHARGGGGGRRSDITLKHDIVLLGHLANGVGYYRFRYIGSDRTYVGVMAQDLQAVVPEAVTRGQDGTLRVFYDKLGIKFQTFEQWIASGARVPTGVSIAY